MAIPSFPRFSPAGTDRTKKVLEMERMHGSRARYHLYYTINGTMHIHPSWAKTATIAAGNMASTIEIVHRGAKYALIGAIKLQKVEI